MSANDILGWAIVCGCTAFMFYRMGKENGWQSGYQTGWNAALSKVAELNSLDEISRIFERMNRR